MRVPFQSSLLPRIKSNAGVRRLNVISEELCDDVLRRLGPSLSPYTGGTIIDYLPGCGLFSRKLHDFLKPRRHILLEPEWDVYSPFLQPLLDEPESKYHHRRWLGHDIWHTKRYIDDGLLPVEEEPGHHTLQIVNATSPLLKTTKKPRTRDSDGIGLRYAQHAHFKSEFHARGPSRILMWCDDYNSGIVIPRNVQDRRKEAIHLESFCHVDEVVGFDKSQITGTREWRIDVASARLAAQRMEEHGVDTPESRKRPAVDDIQVHGEIPRAWHDEYMKLEKEFKAGTLRADPPNPRYEQLKEYRKTFRYETKRMPKMTALLEEQRAIDELDLQRHAPNLDEHERQKIVDSIAQRTADVKERASKFHKTERGLYAFCADNDYSFRMIPGPLLMWDRRSYEPLTAKLSEFHPQRKYALLDFQDKPAERLPMTRQEWSYYITLVTDLFLKTGTSNLKNLDLLAPGLYEYMQKAVPELRDIREGGRWDVDSLRARVITPRMIWRLALAWDKWPFKAAFDSTKDSQAFHLDSAIF